MNTSPIWPLRARCFGGPVSRVAALKVGALYMWPILSTPQGKAENWSSLLPQYGTVSRMGLWQQYVSPFWCGCFLSTQCAGITHIVSGSLSAGIKPCIAVFVVHLWEEENSGASYVTILVTSLMLGIQQMNLGMRPIFSPFQIPLSVLSLPYYYCPWSHPKLLLYLESILVPTCS